METELRERVHRVRLRTWIITAAMLIALVMYLLVAVSLEWKVDVVSFAILATAQIISHCAYFPDGEEFGSTNAILRKNKKTYNEKANKISAGKKLTDLRTYCVVEYEERKKRYVQMECSKCDITEEEYEELKANPEKAEKFIRTLGKTRKRRLRRLLYEVIPVKQNSADTVMSAAENDGGDELKDTSIDFKKRSYKSKILKCTVVALFFAMLAYHVRDGITLATVVQIVMYVASILVTAITSYAAGEKSQKVYKNKFYVDLVNFIDGFFEWELSTKAFDFDATTMTSNEGA